MTRRVGLLLQHCLRSYDLYALHELNPDDLALFCVIIEPRHFQKTQLNSYQYSEQRAKFYLESLRTLSQNLEKVGISLCVRMGELEATAKELCQEYSLDFLIMPREHIHEHRETQNRLKNTLTIPVHFSDELTLFSPEIINFAKDAFPTFTQFRKHVEKHYQPMKESAAKLPDSIPTKETAIPSLKALLGRDPEEERTNPLVSGGEDAALRHLKDYFARDLPKTYKQTRNKTTGFDNSTKLSFWLADGSLSPRTIITYLRDYESKQAKNLSTYWIFFELLWREFARWTGYVAEEKMTAVTGLQDRELPWKTDMKKLDLWKKGKTGYAFIDAAMRELDATGYMSNRMRQNVASFLTKNLGIDWRYGAAHFREKLLDHDACSNLLNWQYIAGVGTDAREFRYFNPFKQHERYDKAHDLIYTWIPELKEIPEEYLDLPGKHVGWYPKPIVDFKESLDETKRWFS